MFVKVICFIILVLYTNGAFISQKIVGGDNAFEGQFPYQISLRTINGTYHYCGGSIIDKNYVLTTANCLRRQLTSEVTVVAGSILLSSGGDKYEIEEFISHENYSSRYRENDIALVRLAKPIEYNDNVQPINLPTEDTRENVELTITGWGKTSYPGEVSDNLKVLKVKSTTDEYCLQNQGPLVMEENICTDTSAHKGFCQGDIGGPLVEEKNDKKFVVGIASWNRPCAVGLPDVYTRVYSYIHWIQNNMK